MSFLRGEEDLKKVLTELDKINVIEDIEVNTVWNPDSVNDYRLVTFSIHEKNLYLAIPNNPNKPFALRFENSLKFLLKEGENIELMVKEAIIRMKI